MDLIDWRQNQNPQGTDDDSAKGGIDERRHVADWMYWDVLITQIGVTRSIYTISSQ
jgi:hypothetical protein